MHASGLRPGGMLSLLLASTSLLFGAAIGMTPSAAASPAPMQSLAGATAGSRWTVDFKGGELRVHIDQRTGRAFWFMTYQIVNRTGEERMLAPRFDLLSDDGSIQRSGRDVPTTILRDILRAAGSELTEDQNQIIGPILPGIENARDGIVVWPIDDPTITELTVFISGLSGETTTVENPVSGETVVLSKTLARSYLTPGSAQLRPADPLTFVEERWVWR
ncbi:MAG TPA: hypothetical protein PKC43_11885 [Phycisphaerales bacterium]|nr:hypothetical protein [Phycisphaerales bacterium]HMP38131.1 hypothetical protein [Phycisphaerales bacterium]